ncbi:TPA: SDR family NAD(P)-dependent oxidoreductase [Providencia stuartii]|uniref:SDR family NAD(P)-dependent oxidoreductase n=3 Tax=Providencia stuartii TaxID=588 RepID=A0AAJ1N370_PROST|nr:MULTISPECIES: SDR family oxidoreductase [Providencia]SST00071.1 3-hydroxybutyrate dehydrogenase [Acinetobacter baumannii]AFH92439.1 putative 3-ketoacyl-(acyl-carrier-protein) reductase [Providencia stuartii MRSN 2154]AIN62632.1 short chain dehydrogenase family protein [Providencia stuartii]AMG65362.1 SDR family NAD(P)-dependent oxidoreductase [Providencia stuartii]APG50539.1 3-oxoacyl-ACP reductase [Providencia stuartii]
MNSRSVIITGGGTGIGAACAQLFTQQGDQVFIVGRRAEPLNAVALETGAIAIVADVSTETSWNEIILPQIKQHTSTIDVLVCNAGGMGLGRVEDMNDQQWHQAMKANLDSAFASVRGCIPLLTQSHGNVLFVGSLASLAAGPEACGYVTAKHALIGLMRSVARDYGHQGVRANAVCPGWVRTPMADEEMQPLMEQHQFTLDDAYRYVCRDVPLQRPATAKEVALACRFLCSTDASMITGAALVIDGGASVVDLPTLAFT